MPDDRHHEPRAGGALDDAPPARRESGAAAGTPATVRDPLGLEALGLLASGIAHDFNNILAAVRGNAGLARDALSGPVPNVAAARDDLVEVERAVERASALVRQLLAFGRRQPRAPEPLDLNRLARDASALLRVLLGEAIQLTLRLDPEVPPVHADRSQVEQVLMNLALNGRDAILEARPGGGGALTVATALESLAGADVRRAGVPVPGPYVRLLVRDDGVGMSAATRARIFEPFFTTKMPDRGTGLGLAAVWGIVRQSGGGIAVQSVPGEGSAFAVYLPVAVPQGAAGGAGGAGSALATDPGAADARPAAAAQAPPPPPARPAADRASTVLLAEDDHAVRRVAARILRNFGYRVLEAGDGRSALALWRSHAAEVAVIVADVRMPQLRGDDLAAAVWREAPGVPVVLMTGFAEEPAGPGGGAPGGATRVLAKPFAAAELLAAVGEALAAQPADGGRAGARGP